MSEAVALWPWALKVYARDDVQVFCLDLQDNHGQSVPFLLWASWAAEQGRAAPDTVVQAAVDLARMWEAEMVGPLRQVRRRLRGMGLEELRHKVRAVELDAERALMARLEALTPADVSQTDLEAAVVAAGRSWNPSADAEVLKHFASILR